MAEPRSRCTCVGVNPSDTSTQALGQHARPAERVHIPLLLGQKAEETSGKLSWRHVSCWHLGGPSKLQNKVDVLSPDWLF